MHLYYYPENLAAKAVFWLWELRDLVIIGFPLLLSILALTQVGIKLPLIATALFAFLSIRFDGEFAYWTLSGERCHSSC